MERNRDPAGSCSARRQQRSVQTFVRLKPLLAADGKETDRRGGAKAAKQVSGWDEAAGRVTVSGGAGPASTTLTYEYPAAVIGPQASQQSVYQTIAQPLVHAFLAGSDVDLLTYGQTGSGKTFTMFGPPFSMKRAAEGCSSSSAEISSTPQAAAETNENIVREEHGFILRAGLEALEAVRKMNANGVPAVLHGSMVEMSITSLTNQSVSDLLNRRQRCYVDDQHHLQGATMLPLRTPAAVVEMAAAVETRLVRGTRMNDTSSRSHCVSVFTLTTLDKPKGASVRASRLQFFDLMGSERFKGSNAAHNSARSSKATESGWEGIFANISLSSLLTAVESAAAARRKAKKTKNTKTKKKKKDF